MILPSEIFDIDRERRVLTIEDSALTPYNNINRGMPIRIQNARSKKIGVFHLQGTDKVAGEIQSWKYAMVDDINQIWFLVVLND